MTTDDRTDTALFDLSTAQEAAPAVESWLDFQQRYARTPGVQAAIRVGDELVLSTALGFSDEPAGIPLRTDHLFRVASHSKMFTGTAVLQLVEQGKLRLDDPVQTYVPELAGSALAAATVRELLGHQAGVIRDGIDKDYWQLMDPFLGREELIGLCRSHGRVFEPNEHFKYSNVGYSLLGLVIEAAGGSSYGDYLAVNIVDRLGLRNTGAEWDPRRADQYAGGHTGLLAGDDRREVIPHADTRAMAPATGVYSTAEDLTAFGAAQFFGAEKLLTDASKRLMQRDESLVIAFGNEIERYGLGMEIVKIGERRLVGHSGGYPGHTTRTFIDPVDKLAVSVLTNCIAGPAVALATGVMRLLELAAKPPVRTKVPDGVDVRRFCGRFANLTAVMEIALLGGRLVALYPAYPSPLDGYEELEVVDANTLRVLPTSGFGSVGERVEYTWDADGRPAVVRYGGSSRWPIDVFRARRTEHIEQAVLGRPEV
ncbi:beta-lactamase family protein [Kribbella sandramycini]|uniref:Beta-lactamase family protein n=1 Tax=Kribbella sandramycini TaxID=60450 RepID=A0A7Y4L402_9ACTN|nr:serine hydrolase domain-containing protein [Kribbella sandramycini]MBB6570775.1 CubicO group peptidase (beta-lactamase class C family) [Kribbella sandramycini]NOL43915.1 beta-lactamase family protein [Kribbella sandramycini]